MYAAGQNPSSVISKNMLVGWYAVLNKSRLPASSACLALALYGLQNFMFSHVKLGEIS